MPKIGFYRNCGFCRRVGGGQEQPHHVSNHWPLHWLNGWRRQAGWQPRLRRSAVHQQDRAAGAKLRPMQRRPMPSISAFTVLSCRHCSAAGRGTRRGACTSFMRLRARLHAQTARPSRSRVARSRRSAWMRSSSWSASTACATSASCCACRCATGAARMAAAWQPSAAQWALVVLERVAGWDAASREGYPAGCEAQGRPPATRPPPRRAATRSRPAGGAEQDP